MKPSDTASDYFAALIDSYDSLIRRAAPRYEEMTQALVGYLPEDATRVLELGCGTGTLSLALARRYPTAHITFVDAADEMVDLTRQRVTPTQPESTQRAQFVVARFEELQLTDGSYDLITSSISLHHVADKLPLFRKLHGALRGGGRFTFADQMRAAPESSHRRNWQEWLAFCRLPGNCTEAEIESLVAHAEAHDYYETVADQLRKLDQAGFGELDCLWRHGMWAIVTASRMQ